MAIPRLIHHVWFGGPPTPLVLRCRQSWQKYCSDWEIILWNESNVNLHEMPLYVRQAAYKKKWAFVADYIRVWALYSQGGFYFDSDFELKGPLDDFRKYNFVTGSEKYDQAYGPMTALIGAQKGFWILEDLLQYYKSKTDFDMTTNLQLFQRILERKGIVESGPWDGHKMVLIPKGGVIFPYWFFCTPESGQPNYGIHHFAGSWLPLSYRLKKRIKTRLRSMLRGIFG